MQVLEASNTVNRVPVVELEYIEENTNVLKSTRLSQVSSHHALDKYFDLFYSHSMIQCFVKRRLEFEPGAQRARFMI